MQYVPIIHHYIGNRRQENNSLGRIGVPGQISRVVPAAAVSTALGWIVVRMAELLMKSATVESETYAHPRAATLLDAGADPGRHARRQALAVRLLTG